MVIGCHGDAVAGRTDNHAKILLSLLHCLGQWVSKIGIVATLFAVATVIFHLCPGVLQEKYHLLFEVIARMVAGDGDFHFIDVFHTLLFLFSYLLWQGAGAVCSFAFVMLQPSLRLSS